MSRFEQCCAWRRGMWLRSWVGTLFRSERYWEFAENLRLKAATTARIPVRPEYTEAPATVALKSLATKTRMILRRVVSEPHS